MAVTIPLSMKMKTWSMRRKSYDTTSKYRRISIFSRKRWQEGLSFVADWCGDCRYIYPALPEIEETIQSSPYSSGPRPVYGFGQTLGCLWNP